MLPNVVTDIDGESQHPDPNGRWYPLRVRKEMREVEVPLEQNEFPFHFACAACGKRTDVHLSDVKAFCVRTGRKEPATEQPEWEAVKAVTRDRDGWWRIGRRKAGWWTVLLEDAGRPDGTLLCLRCAEERGVTPYSDPDRRWDGGRLGVPLKAELPTLPLKGMLEKEQGAVNRRRSGWI